MRTTIITILLALGAGLGLSGCFFDGFFSRYDRGDDAWADDGDYRAGRYGSSEATWAELNGELGGHAIALSDVRGSAYGDGYGSTIEVETTEGGDWVLFRLSLDRDLADPAIEPGTVLSSDRDYVSLMGCTGDAPGVFDYDGYASDVEVTVNDGELAGQRRVELVATFDDAGSARTIRATVLLEASTPTDTGWDTGATVPSRSDATYAEHQATWTELSSDLGPVGPYTLTSVRGSAWSDGYGSEIEIDTIGDDGRWVMFALSLDQDLDDIEPGTTVSGDLLGCVGPTRGSYDFDGHDYSAQLHVEQGASTSERVGTLTASYSTAWGTQTVTATVTYEVFN